MTRQTFDRVLRWVRVLNPTGQPNTEPVVWLQGFGEPMLHPNLLDFIADLSEETAVGFSTNGELLTPENLEALEAHGLTVLTISHHKPLVAKRAVEMVKSKPNRGFKLMEQKYFDDDFAGQIPRDKVPHTGIAGFDCEHISSGGLHILWDGMIPNCCVDGWGYPILGSVYDEEIRNIEIDLTPLCRTCRHATKRVGERLYGYSDSLALGENSKGFGTT